MLCKWCCPLWILLNLCPFYPVLNGMFETVIRVQTTCSSPLLPQLCGILLHENTTVCSFYCWWAISLHTIFCHYKLYFCWHACTCLRISLGSFGSRPRNGIACSQLFSPPSWSQTALYSGCSCLFFCFNLIISITFLSDHINK